MFFKEICEIEVERYSSLVNNPKVIYLVASNNFEVPRTLSKYRVI